VVTKPQKKILMGKKLYCKKCGTLVIEVIKGKAKPDLYIECNKCQKKDFDLPKGFKDIFGGKI